MFKFLSTAQLYVSELDQECQLVQSGGCCREELTGNRQVRDTFSTRAVISLREREEERSELT